MAVALLLSKQGISLSTKVLILAGFADRESSYKDAPQAGVRGFNMSIRKKLYWGFGLILITVFGLFLVNMFAVLHEHSARDTAKKAVEMVQAMSKLEQVRQQNRLRLRNFL